MKALWLILLVAAGVLLCAALFLAARRLAYFLIDRRIDRFQSELIEKQITEIENMYRQVRGWRHDYRNHIQNMKIQLHEKNYAGLDQYLDSLADDLAVVDTTIKTGNVMADAILNCKLSVAGKQQVRLTVKANIPCGLPLSDVELCAVLGNLLDNATEACARLPEEKRFLRVYIGTLKNQLYISVQNSAGEVCRENGIYRSTKPGEHGYGIFRIDRIARKYGGFVNRQNEEGVFATELLLPLGEKNGEETGKEIRKGVERSPQGEGKGKRGPQEEMERSPQGEEKGKHGPQEEMERSPQGEEKGKHGPQEGVERNPQGEEKGKRSPQEGGEK